MKSLGDIITNKSGLEGYFDKRPQSNLRNSSSNMFKTPEPYLKKSVFDENISKIHQLSKYTYEQNKFDILYKNPNVRENQRKSDEFHLKNLDLTLNLHPNIRMNYENTPEFQDITSWIINKQKLNNNSGLVPIPDYRYVRWGLCKKTFNIDTKCFYISINVPSNNILEWEFPNKTHSFKEAIKTYIYGHEETHAAIEAGELTKVLKLLEYNYPEYNHSDITLFAKKIDDLRNEWHDFKRCGEIDLQHHFQEDICNKGGIIALKKKGFSENMYNEVMKELYPQIYSNT